MVCSYTWLPRLPRASAHVTPLGPGGGRRGGSTWTVTGPLLDFFCALIRPYDCISTTSLDHCLEYTAKYGSGRELCTAKVFSPRLGVALGSFFNAVHWMTLPLASPGSPHWFFKVGIVSLQRSGCQPCQAGECAWRHYPWRGWVYQFPNLIEKLEFNRH